MDRSEEQAFILSKLEELEVEVNEVEAQQKFWKGRIEETQGRLR